VSERERLIDVVAAATAALEQARQRIDDLNVYPVPDGDTGTNLSLTARATLDALEASSTQDRAGLAHETTRATLMGARGNSGVILSQLVRGAADVLGRPGAIDGRATAKALRAASDAGYRAVREPVEGTMLTVIREIATEAEARRTESLRDMLPELVRRGEEAVARTPEQLQALRDAGVVDAGGAGLVELLRGAAAAIAGHAVPETVAPSRVTVDAIHLEPSRYRYCTVFVVEGENLDRTALERELEPLGDSLLVVGDASALKVHVHTDDPGAALRAGTGRGLLEAIEIANMHRQTEAREQRLLHVVPDAPPAASQAVAVVAGPGNRVLYESLGAHVVDGGRSMNPATADLVAAIGAGEAPEAVVLPNNPNVLMAARQAAELATKPVEVVPSRSIQAGLAALVAFDSSLGAADNARRMTDALRSVVTGAVTTASRAVELENGLVDEGSYLGLLDGEPFAGGPDFQPVAAAVADRLLAEPRGLLTLITGADEPPLEPLLERLADRHPEVELDVQSGGQPHFQLLLAAE
jgi:fatty acid kinase